MGQSDNVWASIVILCVALAVASETRAEAYGSGWYGEVQASYGREDNISRTWLTDAPDDRVSTISLGGGHSQKLGDKGQLVLSGYALYKAHDEFDGLDNWAVSLGVDYLFQPTVEYYAPWFRFTSNLTRFEYPDSKARNTWQLDVDMSVSRRLNGSMIGRLGVRGMNRNLRDMSDFEEMMYIAFDREAAEVYATMDVELQKSVFLYAEYGYREGDIISTLPGGPDNGMMRPNYELESPDPVFDQPCTQNCVHGYTYQIDGETHVGIVGLTFPIPSLGVNVDLSSRYFDTEGKDGRSYENWMVSMGFIWNF